MYSTQNEEKSVVAGGFIRTLKNTIYFNINNVYIDNLDEILNTYHITIKMKPADIKNNTYIDFDKKVTIKF